MVVTRKVRTKKDEAPSTSAAPTEETTEKVLPDVSEVEESEAENIEEPSQADEETTVVAVNIGDIKNEGGGEEMVGEGLGLLWFAQAEGVVFAVVAMLVFGLFTHMACGATYALVPFIAPKALGGVAGSVGAGGNVGALAAGFLMKGTGDIKQTLTILSGLVLVASVCAIAARFTATSANTAPAAAAA